MRQIFGGAFLTTAGAAAFIEAASRHPAPCPEWADCHVLGQPAPLSWTAYDALLVAGCALVILGGLLIVIGLVKYGARQVRRGAAERSVGDPAGAGVTSGAQDEQSGRIVTLATARDKRPKQPS
jgi:hypothetical protein